MELRRAEVADLRRAAGLLASEVVGREAEQDEALALVVFVELLEALVLRREAALGRHVDHQHHLALVGRERLRLALEGVGGEIVEATDAWALVGMARPMAKRERPARLENLMRAGF